MNAAGHEEIGEGKKKGEEQIELNGKAKIDNIGKENDEGQSGLKISLNRISRKTADVPMLLHPDTMEPVCSDMVGPGDQHDVRTTKSWCPEIHHAPEIYHEDHDIVVWTPEYIEYVRWKREVSEWKLDNEKLDIQLSKCQKDLDEAIRNEDFERAVELKAKRDELRGCYVSPPPRLRQALSPRQCRGAAPQREGEMGKGLQDRIAAGERGAAAQREVGSGNAGAGGTSEAGKREAGRGRVD